mmetsp:Transcript_19716/g.66275  ORF Transcript_19716/g.66275 Transcript_19716/m.66275 type:complete len:201 (+) Transcript_19716:480-1082(+)
MTTHRSPSCASPRTASTSSRPPWTTRSASGTRPRASARRPTRATATRSSAAWPSSGARTASLPGRRTARCTCGTCRPRPWRTPWRGTPTSCWACRATRTRTSSRPGPRRRTGPSGSGGSSRRTTTPWDASGRAAPSSSPRGMATQMSPSPWPRTAQRLSRARIARMRTASRARTLQPLRLSNQSWRMCLRLCEARVATCL